jgi:hypothetical protein
VALTQAGALATIAGVLVASCGDLGAPGPGAVGSSSTSTSSAAAASRLALLARHEVLSVVLGLLINLAAARPDNQRALAALQLQPPGAESPGLPQQPVQLVPLLCDILNLLDGPGAAAGAGAAGAAAGAAGGSPPADDPGSSSSPAAHGRPLKTFSRGSGGGGSPGAAQQGPGAEVTEAELHHEEGQGVASILEM